MGSDRTLSVSSYSSGASTTSGTSPNSDSVSPPSKRSSKKIWHTKVRTGCAQCKRRHLRCDETKPSCLRCRKTGLECPGYNPPRAKIFEIHNSLTFDDPLEKECFDYFVTEGAPVLMGFQPSARPFMAKYSPQLSHASPAIKHSLIALGAFQEPLHYYRIRPLIPKNSNSMFLFALSQYSKAMHAMANPEPNQTSPEIAICCCFLFMALTIWIEKASTPQVHTRAALRLLEEYEASARKGLIQRSPAIDESLGHTARRLAFNACVFSDDFKPTNYPSIIYDPTISQNLNIPSTFHFFDDAFECIDTLYKCVLLATSENELFGSLMDAKIQKALTTFPETLHRMNSLNTNITYRFQSGAKATNCDFAQLAIFHRMAKIMFSTFGSDNEMNFDEHNHDFTFILQQYEILLDQEQEVLRTKIPLFRANFGLISPMFFVATRCRIASIRKKAIENMHSVFRTERRMTSCTATTLARFVVETEGQLYGENPSKPVPAAKRIRLEHVRFSRVKEEMYVEYSRHNEFGQRKLGVATLPYQACPIVDSERMSPAISRKVLRGCTYSGIILYSPQIQCHCVEWQEGAMSVTDSSSISLQRKVV